MGGLCTNGVDSTRALLSEDAKNKRISKDQQQAARQNDIIVKLLLLGTGDSGKTTCKFCYLLLLSEEKY